MVTIYVSPEIIALYFQNRRRKFLTNAVVSQSVLRSEDFFLSWLYERIRKTSPSVSVQGRRKASKKKKKGEVVDTVERR